VELIVTFEKDTVAQLWRNSLEKMCIVVHKKREDISMPGFFYIIFSLFSSALSKSIMVISVDQCNNSVVDNSNK